MYRYNLHTKDNQESFSKTRNNLIIVSNKKMAALSGLFSLNLIMKISTSFKFSILYVGLFISCSSKVESNQKVIFNNDILSECNHAIQNAVVLDGVTPPVASRRYFYSCVAAYEAIQPFNSKYLSTSKQFNGFTDKPIVDTTLGYCLDLVALSAYTTTARQLVYKEDSINHFRERKLTHYKNILHSKVFER